jgi:hypothetical protein
MIRELIDSELEVVAGGDGFLNTNFVSQYLDAHQSATANANASSIFGIAAGGTATAVNVGGTNVLSSVIS